jgi:hypothetical protein
VNLFRRFQDHLAFAAAVKHEHLGRSFDRRLIFILRQEGHLRFLPVFVAIFVGRKELIDSVELTLDFLRAQTLSRR